ncbi:kinase-like domain-containing protein [Trichoderma ceciliae]
MARRACASCGHFLPQSSYTTTQWIKGRGLSRCMGCVHGHHSDTPTTAQSDSGRHNQSSSGTVSHGALQHPFAQGSFRWVAKGKYTSGPRRNQACVVKWFKSGAVFSDDYFTYDVLAVGKALEIVNRFNQARVVTKTIKINVPEVWSFREDAEDEWAGQKHLCEPFIQNYQNHFSYHISGGNHVLCDLQGGIYQHEVILSDPVILSRCREYGVTDLGPDGISSFFSLHECNGYCRPNWSRPASPVQVFRPVQSTTMVRRYVPTVRSRPGDTRSHG